MRQQTITSFVGTFCKPEMWHVYNQVHGIQRYRSLVVTRERRYESLFPHGGVHELYSYQENARERFRKRWVEGKNRLEHNRSVTSLAKQLDGLKTDLLHIYFGHEATRLAPFLKIWDKPTVVSFHGADLGNYVRRPQDIVWLPTVFEQCRLILARCEYFRHHLVELGCPPEKIRINRTHVRADYFERVDHPPPEGGRWNLLQACRFIPKKGMLVTIRAFAKFLETYPRAALYLAGDGPQLGALQREVWSLGLTRRVFFTGFLERDALRSLFGQCHFFLHPSATDSANDIEGIPNTLLEAMCAGLPSISTAHAGIPEAITSGENGFLVNGGEVEAVVDVLMDLTRDPEKYRAVSHAAAASVRAVYQPEVQVRALEDIYAEGMA